MPRSIQFDPTASFTTSRVSSTNQYTKLYLPFDSSVTADGSPENVTVTSYGQASLNTSTKAVGASSLNLSESNGSDYLTFPTMALTGDFTIEGFFRTTIAQTGNRPSGREAIFTYSIYNDASNYSGLSAWLNGDGKFQIRASSGGNSWDVMPEIDSGNVSQNTWHHFAMTRQGDTYRIYLDGTRETEITNSNGINTSAATSAIGSRDTSGGYGFSGQIDDFRILSGLALYTGSSLTVPTSPVTADVTATVNDTRSYTSVFDLRTQYKERAAGNWPS